MKGDALVVRPAGRLEPDEVDEVRCALAICAAALGVLIAIYQQHFTLSFSDRHSFHVMLTHRCGLTMIAGMAWMAAETATLTWKRSWRTWAVGR